MELTVLYSEHFWLNLKYRTPTVQIIWDPVHQLYFSLVTKEKGFQIKLYNI
jgi:hypothetical protein